MHEPNSTPTKENDVRTAADSSRGPHRPRAPARRRSGSRHRLLPRPARAGRGRVRSGGRLDGAAFLAAGDYHHHVALNTWQTDGGSPPPAGHTGLHHFAILLPDAEALAAVVRRLLESGYPLDGALDHGGTVAVYLHDPDGNGIELSYDRPRGEWFDSDGSPILKADPFDPRRLLAEVDAGDHPEGERPLAA